MSAAFPELSLKLSARRWAFVLDPMLALSAPGLALVRQASGLAQLWLPRSLWHILDSSDFYAQRPQALCADTQQSQRLVQAIRAWEALRRTRDLAGAALYWLGDGLDESSLPDKADGRLLAGYEQLACALARRSRTGGPMDEAMRDTVALAAALGGAGVLGLLPAGADAQASPAICQALQGWDVPCQKVDTSDSYAAHERQQIWHLLSLAGLAATVWAGWRPTVLRLALDDPWPALGWGGGVAQAGESGDADAAEAVDAAAPLADGLACPGQLDAWQGARAFWFEV